MTDRPSPSWRQRLDDFWFPQTTAVRLAVLRIVTVGLQLVWFMPSRGALFFHIKGSEHFIEPQALIQWILRVVPQEPFRTVQCFGAIHTATVIAGVAALVGLLTRPALLIFALGNWVMLAHNYSYGEKHHSEALYCIFLMLLALGPAGRCLSLDSVVGRRFSLRHRWGASAVFYTAMWPLLLTQVLFGIIYLGAGLCKLKMGGLDWFNGHTMQHYLLQDGFRWDRPLGQWAAQQYWLCVAMSVFAVAFELFFFLTVPFRKLVGPFILAGVALHIGIYFLQAAPFWEFMVLYLVFTPVERLPIFPKPDIAAPIPP